MSLLPILLLVILFGILWNVATVAFLTTQARRGKLTRMKFSSSIIIGFSFIVSAILYTSITYSEGYSLKAIRFVLLVFSFIVIVGFPVIYLASKFWLKEGFFAPKFISKHDDQKVDNAVQGEKPNDK